MEVADQSPRRLREFLHGRPGAVVLVGMLALSGCGNDEPRLSGAERTNIEAAFRAYIDARNASAVTSDMLCAGSKGTTIPAGTSVIVDRITDITLTGDSALIKANTQILHRNESGAPMKKGHRNWPMTKENGQWKYCPPTWSRGTDSPHP